MIDSRFPDPTDIFLTATCSLIMAIFWFGPLFGKRLLTESLDHPEEPPGAFVVRTTILTLLGSMLVALLLHPVLHFLRLEQLPQGKLIGGSLAAAVIWFCFILPVLLKVSFLSKSSYHYVAIKLGYYFAVLQVTGLILGMPA